MKGAPLISIVIAAYNREQLLPITLRSIQEQTCGDWECVIVDDKSSDGTLAVAREWARKDERIRVVASEKNSGPSAARNLGYAESNAGSKYVTFMDCDDLWTPDALSVLAAAAEASPTMAGAHGLAEYIDEDGAPMLPGEFSSHGRKRIGLAEDGTLQEWDLSKPTSFCTLLLRNTVFPPGVVLTRRAYYEKAGLFDAEMGLMEDWDMIVRLSRHGSFAFVNQVVLFYRRHRGNLSTQSQKENVRLVRHLQYKTFRSRENTAEQRAIARKIWRRLQIEGMRKKWKMVRERIAAGNIAGAGVGLARIYIEIHRFLRGYPTARGL